MNVLSESQKTGYSAQVCLERGVGSSFIIKGREIFLSFLILSFVSTKCKVGSSTCE